MYCLADSRCSLKGSRKRCIGALHMSSVAGGWARKEGGRKVRSCWAVGCRTLGGGLIPEFEKASLIQTAPTPRLVSPGAARKRRQRWVSPSLGLGRPSAFSTAAGSVLSAAFRVSKVTPGGHRGDDSRTAVFPPTRPATRPSWRGCPRAPLRGA